jgi:uncharacterized secreted protein with C-terminal beta-propeller domain
MEQYYEAQPPHFYRGGLLPVDTVTAMPSVTAPANDSTVSGAPQSKVSESQQQGDFSLTNTRTLGVDEPEKVKTDGKYLYAARIEDKAIFITTAEDTPKLITKILLPGEYTSAELFIDGNRMILIAGKNFWNESFRNAWIDRSNKTVAVVYDITDRSAPKIERYTQIDGYVREARMENGMLTLMTSTAFNFPYDRYMPKVKAEKLELDLEKLSADFSTQNVLPKRIDFVAKKVTSDIGASIQSARKIGRATESDATSCANVHYVLPDAKTLAQYRFNPTFTAITRINTRNSAVKPTTSLMFGDVDKAYLSPSNTLYLTSSLYTDNGFVCPRGALCAMRFPVSGMQTILHAFTLKNTAQYKGSTLVEGNLISDYAIDENSSKNIRIVTQKQGAEHESLLTILSPKFEKLGQLAGLGKGENFQSARFMGDRLYLVTFQQIDPLYVIDVADDKNPKILGELKIPGYSTYLHPYDSERLIGIGYDTTTNEWGGVVNSGIKVDLYNVKDVNKPIQEGTLTLGGVGSSSDALSNPRLFVWRAAAKTLYLPALLTTSGAKPYEYADIFQGLVAVRIDPSNASGVVKELARTSHIVWNRDDLLQQRNKECSAYVPKQEKTCRKLISGEEVCTTGDSTYVPNYCYADAGIGAYKANQIWNQRSRFIDRVLFSGERVFTFSRAKIETLEGQTLRSKGFLEFPEQIE